MPKFLIRIVAFLLVPCLLADPTLAYAIVSPHVSGHQFILVKNPEEFLEQEALTVRARWFLHVLED